MASARQTSWQFTNMIEELNYCLSLGIFESFRSIHAGLKTGLKLSIAPPSYFYAPDTFLSRSAGCCSAITCLTRTPETKDRKVLCLKEHRPLRQPDRELLLPCFLLPLFSIPSALQLVLTFCGVTLLP